LGYEILSTGGTLNQLQDAKVNATAVDDITKFPEILGGRVKTLHPNIHGGLLAKRDNESHVKELETQKIDPIDLVVVNLYLFKEIRNTVHDDGMIEKYFTEETGELFTATFTRTIERIQSLRYGEKPHQAATFYDLPNYKGVSLATANQLHGKELSYNNIQDAN